MKTDSKAAKKPTLKPKKDNNISNKKFSPKKTTKEVKLSNLNSKSTKLSIKPPTSPKKPKSININVKSNDLKEQLSLFKKEQQTLKNEEEKIKELKNKLKLLYNIDHMHINTINHNDKNIKATTAVKIKKRNNKNNFSPPPVSFKKNLLNLMEKSTKSKKEYITSHSNTNINKPKRIIKQKINRPKININLFSPITRKFDFHLQNKDFKNKYNSPYKTVYSTRNPKTRILFDFDKKGSPKKNKNLEESKKIGILTKAGVEKEDKKKINQDNYFNYDLKNGYKFIGVCDGHGENGKKVSDFIKTNLPKELETEFNVLITNEKKRLSILEGMLKHDEENNSEKKEKFNIEKYIDYEKMKELLKNVFISTNLKLFAENMKLNLKTSGSTCVSIFYKKKDLKKLYIANAGDSRAIVIKELESSSENNNNTWSYEQLSRDHKPSEKEEAERIIKCGGEIQKIQNEDGTFEGPLRIFQKNEEGPGLAMSRSFGDSEGEKLGIIAEPDVKEYLIKKEDKALIIATDGLWEYTTNEEVVNIVKKYWKKKDANIINNELYKLAVDNWKKKHCTIDDITIISLFLN